MIAANDNLPPDQAWRAELMERAPGIVARALNSASPARLASAEWWRRQFMVEFGRDPLPAAPPGR